MACCLKASSHYTTQWLLIISEVQWRIFGDAFSCLNIKSWIPLNFVSKVLIGNKPSLVQIMAWHRTAAITIAVPFCWHRRPSWPSYGPPPLGPAVASLTPSAEGGGWSVGTAKTGKNSEGVSYTHSFAEFDAGYPCTCCSSPWLNMYQQMRA